MARKQPAVALLLIGRCLEFMKGELEGSTEKTQWIRRCQENMVLCGVLGGAGQAGRSERSCYSYKISYRKAQLCLKLYHECLQSRRLPWSEVHDSHETTYYHVNQPYYQQKGRNKNPNYTNGIHYYPRFALPVTFSHTAAPGSEVAQPAPEKKELKRESKKENKKNGTKSKKKRKTEEEL